MSEPTSQEPTEEELSAYLDQLRNASPSELVAQAYTMLGTGAEVKLGRPDARVLIDALAALTEATAAGIGDDLAARMRNGVAQLQSAQVQAERQAGGEQPEPEPVGQEQAGAAGQPAAPGQQPAQPGQPGQPGSAGQAASDRLWVPGRP